MKEQILKLREQGKSYKEICKELGCSKSLVSYHCGKGQKEKTLERQRKSRADLVILKRVENFQYDRRIKDKSEDFQRTRTSKGAGKRNLTFSWRDVIEEYGWETTCYLTGEKIDLRKPKTYNFDHIKPVSKGGKNTIDNLGICLKEVNAAKYDLEVSEFLDLCQKVLEHNGYEVKRNIQ